MANAPVESAPMTLTLTFTVRRPHMTCQSVRLSAVVNMDNHLHGSFSRSSLVIMQHCYSMVGGLQCDVFTLLPLSLRVCLSVCAGHTVTVYTACYQLQRLIVLMNTLPLYTILLAFVFLFFYKHFQLSI